MVNILMGVGIIFAGLGVAIMCVGTALTVFGY